MKTLSPQQVIVYSITSIPLGAQDVVLVLYDPHLLDTNHLPSKIKLTLENFGDTVSQFIVDDADESTKTFELPPTLTYLTTGHKFNQPVFNLHPALTHLTTGH
jgi:hypothetical protein